MNDNEDDVIWYGWNIKRDSVEGNTSSKWASYNKTTGAFRFKLSRTNRIAEFLQSNTDNSENAYDLIVADIKSKCNYNDIVEHNGNSYVTYSCSESSYKGKIGFMIFEGSGYIRHFPPKD